MKILFSHRFFWPDTAPYATMLRSIAGRLAAEGHDVTVFSTQPSYHSSSGKTAPASEVMDGFSVVRMPIFKERKRNLPLRVFNVFAYVAGLRRHILEAGDYDIISASSFPPIVAARIAVGAAHKIGSRFIYHVQDIHPEVSLYSGQLKPGRIFNFLQRLDSTTCRKSDALVVLSRDMADSLQNRPGNDHLHPDIINNLPLENFCTSEVSGSPILPDDKFTILFAGNMGHFQNLITVVEAAHKLSDLEEVQFWFVGEGVTKQSLIEKAGVLIDKSVFFLPFQHHSVAQKLMEQANLNLVSLAPDIYRVAYPSKTMAIFSRSAPILAAVEAQSELGRLVVESRIGYVANQKDPQSIADAVRTAYHQRDRRHELRNRVKRIYDTRFSRDRILDLWCDLTDRLK